jgi:hypothetical protein
MRISIEIGVPDVVFTNVSAVVVAMDVFVHAK